MNSDMSFGSKKKDGNQVIYENNEEFVFLIDVVDLFWEDSEKRHNSEINFAPRIKGIYIFLFYFVHLIIRIYSFSFDFSK